MSSVDDGCAQMGITNVREGVVARGLLIGMLGKAVRRQDIEVLKTETGITISASDELFLGTGRNLGQTGGYHPLLLPPSLKERDVALLGADNTQEGGGGRGSFRSRALMLVAFGVHLFDNLGLEDLAETARAQDRSEFMFMASPYVLPNGAGSAINPLAVF